MNENSDELSKQITCSLFIPCRWAGSVAQVTAHHKYNATSLKINTYHYPHSTKTALLCNTQFLT